MRRNILRTVVTTTFLIALAILGPTQAVHAIPGLQLDIGGGVYSGCPDSTTCAQSSQFTLYAILTPQTNATPAEIAALLNTKYYISAALVPQQSTDGAFGSFEFAGSTINVTGDMLYGVPPVDVGGSATQDPGDLPTHGIYETYFAEFQFMFDSNNKTNSYDVQTAADPHAGPTPDANGNAYYAAFVINTSLLQSGKAIHFDLYSTKEIRNCLSYSTGGGPRVCTQWSGVVDIDALDNAPFSHDAQSSNSHAPEPGSFLLLGSGVAALGIIRYRKMKKA